MKDQKKSFEDRLEEFCEFCNRPYKAIDIFWSRIFKKSKKDKKVVIPEETRKKTTVPKESNSWFRKFKKFLNQVSDSTTAKTVKSSIIATLAVLILGGISLWGMFVITGNILWIITGTIFLLGANWMIEKGFKGIPASDPPCVGLVTIWNKKTNIVLHEGLKLIAPYFPFYFNVILIDMEKKNEDFLFKKVTCHSEKGKGHIGGDVTVGFGLTFIPDIKNLINYINSGGEKGVRDIIEDKLSAEVRQMGNKRTWQEMTFAKHDLAVRLILKLVKEGDENQKPELKEYYALKPEEKKDSEKILPILERALVGGITDGYGLGIKILMLNMKSVEPEGELGKESSKVAIEEIQKEAEIKEIEATGAIIDFFKDKGASSDKAIDDAQVQQGKAKKIVISSGKDKAGDVTKGASILTLMERRNN